MSKIKQRLKVLYPNKFEEVYKEVEKLIEKWKPNIKYQYSWVEKEDIILITYGDAIQNGKEAPLKTLKIFLDKELKGCISAVHILPMFPYTSDDGFSVSDFRLIHPDLGSWEEITQLRENYDLMFDAVINHASKESIYFQEFLQGTKEYENFFIVADKNKDYSMVTRPRAFPLLTEFETKNGTKYIWTTFSEDQIDFNYKEPKVLLEILDILLLYAAKGARFLRFDAIGFAWKEENTSCMHLKQTHELIKLMREVLEECAKGCTIITETNVPHKDNISYFGNGYDEAGLVYQFPLPPLTLYSFLKKDASKLAKWASSLEPTTQATTYFNFLASHDGIGIRPVEDILSKEEKKQMEMSVLERGGQISYRSMPDGSMVPYEFNINFLDAIAADEKELDQMVQKYMASQCILLSVIGVPGIYYHSLLGSRNCYKEVEETGIKRRINREKLNFEQLEKELAQTNSLRAKVLNSYRRLIQIRKAQEAFSPNSPQEVLFLDNRLFSFIRGKLDQRILVIINVSKDEISLDTNFRGVDLITKKKILEEITIKPYDYLWIQLETEEEFI